MIRPILFLLFLCGVVYGIYYVVSKWRNRLDRSLKRRFKKMRKLILKGIGSSQKDRAKKLLADCEDYLDMTLTSYERMQELKAMRKDANALVGDTNTVEQHEKLEKKIRHSMETFLSRLYLISSEVTFDWKRSLDQLEEFTEELEEQRKVFLDLNDDDVVFDEVELEDKLEAHV